MAAANDTTKQSVYYDTDSQPGLEIADADSANTLKGFYAPGTLDGIEVVPNQEGEGGKEVLPGSHPPLERSSSLNQPESWHVPHQQQPLMNGEGEGGGERDYEVDKEAAGVPSKWTRRRYCGMRGKWLAILLAGISLVIIIAAVLGGVLASVLPSPDSSSSRGGAGGSTSGTNGGTISGGDSQAVTGSRKAISQSGIAATFLGSDNSTLLTYYQDESGRIIENVYTDGAWATDTSSAAAVVAKASQGSPLTAISYNYNYTTWRQVFFVADDNSLWTTKATADGAWEEPKQMEIERDGSTNNITGTHVAHGPALAACESRSLTDHTPWSRQLTCACRLRRRQSRWHQSLLRRHRRLHPRTR
jgi:hypothetical protein